MSPQDISDLAVGDKLTFRFGDAKPVVLEVEVTFLDHASLPPEGLQIAVAKKIFVEQ